MYRGRTAEVNGFHFDPCFLYGSGGLLAMRFSKLALVASAFILAACGGNKDANDDSAAVAASGDTLSAGAATATPATTGGAGAPITGTTHEVKMVGDEKGYRF